jgi:hypothetical protein
MRMECAQENRSELKATKTIVMSQFSTFFSGFVFLICITASFLVGRSVGMYQYVRPWYKVNLINLIALEEEGDSIPNEALLNLVRAQTYSTARYVPDSWLPKGRRYGPVDKHLLGPINAVKDPTSLGPDYEEWVRRTKIQEQAQ